MLGPVVNRIDAKLDEMLYHRAAGSPQSQPVRENG
jgi:hypothetical protein